MPYDPADTELRVIQLRDNIRKVIHDSDHTEHIIPGTREWHEDLANNILMMVGEYLKELVKEIEKLSDEEEPT